MLKEFVTGTKGILQELEAKGQINMRYALVLLVGWLVSYVGWLVGYVGWLCCVGWFGWLGDYITREMPNIYERMEC